MNKEIFFFYLFKLQKINIQFLNKLKLDKKFYITKLENVKLPDIKSSHLKSMCESNINGNYYKFFQFKLFNYIYDKEISNFTSLKFYIKTTQENIQTIFIKGLNNQEIIYQKSIFGESDLNINIDSVFALIIKEVTDPFYIFQLFSVLLWFFNDYQQYAVIIVITTLISLIVSVYETRVNLVNIRKMAKFNCKINVFRQTDVLMLFILLF